jgi:hypothetical protein
MPLNVPRKNDAWDGFRDMVAFPAEDGDTRAPVGCAITDQTLREHFGADVRNVTSLLRTFRRYRPMIEAAASSKYDALGKPEFVVLFSADFISSGYAHAAGDAAAVAGE